MKGMTVLANGPDEVYVHSDAGEADIWGGREAKVLQPFVNSHCRVSRAL